MALDAIDVASFASIFLRQGNEDPLASIPVLMRKFWDVKLGFYYFFSDLFEVEYLPDGCFATEARCYVCGSQLREKRLLHGGLGAPLDYSFSCFSTQSWLGKMRLAFK